jgi:hypothetical protein
VVFTGAIFTDILEFAREFSPYKAAKGRSMNSDSDPGSASVPRLGDRARSGFSRGRFKAHECARPCRNGGQRAGESCDGVE